MSALFISYSRKDKAVATRLLTALAAQSRDVWIDWEDIPPTARWLDEIRVAIEAADAFVFLISPDSVASVVCGQELGHAVGLRKRLIPLVVRDTVADQVDRSLAELNWLFFRETDDFDAAIARLLTAIDTDLDWVRLHTRLLTRAMEWERNDRDDSYLLRGADLQLAEAWLAGAAQSKRPEPAPAHFSYLRASQAAQAREIERLKMLYRNALARQLAAQSVQLQGEAAAMLDRSMLLAVESMRRLPNAEADRVLRNGLRLRARESCRWPHQPQARLLAVSSLGDRVATLAEAGDGVAVHRPDGTPLRFLETAGAPQALTFLPDSPWLCVADGSGTLLLVDTASDAPAREIGRHDGRVRALVAVPVGPEIGTRTVSPGGAPNAGARLPSLGGTPEAGGRLLSPGSAPPLGARLLSLGEGGACCWHADDGSAAWQLPLQAECWTAAASADGARLAIGADDGVLRFVDAASGEVSASGAHDLERPVAVLERGASDAGVVGVAFLNTGLACSAGLDGTVRWWHADDGVQLGQGIHRRDVLCLAVHAGRALVASGSLDGTVRLWDATGRELARLEHQAGVTALAWSVDGLRLASACGDGTARLWAVGGGDQGPTESDLVELARCVHGHWVEAIALAGGDTVVSADDAGAVMAWTVGAPDWRGVDLAVAIKRAVCNADGTQIVAFIDDPTLMVYDVDGFTQRTLPHPDFVDDAWFAPDGALFTACWDGGVREFDPVTLQLRHVQSHGGRVWAVAMRHRPGSDAERIATAVIGEPCVRVWQRGAAAPEATLAHDQQVRALAFSPDGALLLTVCDDGAVSAWDLPDGYLRWRVREPGTAWCIACSPDGQVVASGHDGADAGAGAAAVVLRATDSGEQLHRLLISGSPAALAFRPDGQQLAVSLSFEGPFDVQVWDLALGQCVARLGHEDSVHQMDWSGDGAWLATAGQEGRVRVFDVADRRERIRLQFDGICGGARFMPGGRELLSTSYDGSLRLTPVDVDALCALAIQRVPRRLSDAEWRQYLTDEPLAGRAVADSS